MSTICFYSTRDKYGYLSNFYRSPITIEGKSYLTVEHYFQAMKMADPDTREKVRLCSSPSMAAREGRKRSNRMIPDWEDTKRDVMYRALMAKFTQHPMLRDKLLLTGDSLLIEHTRNDTYWGNGGDGSGQNWLGILLMRVRDSIRQ